MAQMLKTVEEHRYYLEEIVKVSLFVTATYCNKYPESDLYEELDRRTPIYNHTEFNKYHMFDIEQPKPKEWFHLKKKLKEIYLKDRDPDNFEKVAYKLIKPYIYGRIDFDIKDLHGDYDNDDEESWLRYDVEAGSKKVELHFENALYPDSFLSDKKFFYRKLKEAAIDLKGKGVEIVYSGSWLNSYDKFLDLLPPNWRQSRRVVVKDIEFHLGFWGQFLRSNETLNKRAITYLRENGSVMYPEAECQVTIKDLEIFLESKKELLRV
jgi:hypothetical protein